MPQSRPTISVVMPNYNHGRFLRQSLGGVLGQTRPADEILIIDDASTDDSVPIIEEMIRERPQVRLIRRSQRQGVVPNLNLGLAEGRGDLICFPAADDHVYPDFLARAEAALVTHPEAALASGGVELWDIDGKVIGLRPAFMPSTDERHWITPQEVRRMLLSIDNFLLTQVGLFRRSPMLELGGFDAGLGPACDGILARRLIARHGFVFIPAILGVWRMTGTNYFKRTVEEPELFPQMLRRIRAVLAEEPPGIFPPAFPDLLERRFWFGTARHVADSGGENALRGFLRLRGQPSLLDRLAARAASGRGAMSRLVLNGALLLRFRPFSASRLLIEPFRRRRHLSPRAPSGY